MNWKEEFDKIELEFKKDVAKFDEINCYFLINLIVGVVWRHNHDASHGRSVGPEKEIQTLRIKQVHVCLELTRFGFTPTKGEEENYAPTEDYWKWFRWWDEYAQHTLTNEEWRVLEKKMDNKEDVSAYRPEGNWRPIEEITGDNGALKIGYKESPGSKEGALDTEGNGRFFKVDHTR